MNVTEANNWDFPWFSETVPATEFSTKPVTLLVMTVGFNEDRKFDGIDGSATVAITGADEDILAVGEIEAGKLDENTDVKAIGVNLVGLSCWLSDLVDELKIDCILDQEFRGR